MEQEKIKECNYVVLDIRKEENFNILSQYQRSNVSDILKLSNNCLKWEQVNLFINDRFNISQQYNYVQIFFKTFSLRSRRLTRPAIGKLM